MTNKTRKVMDFIKDTDMECCFEPRRFQEAVNEIEREHHKKESGYY